MTLKHRVVCAALGRRWGKTQAAMMAILEQYRQDKYRGREFKAAYCGPTSNRTQPQYDEALKMFGGLVERSNRNEGWIKLRGVNGALGAIIYFWSLHEADNLRGHRLDFAVLDEASDVSESAYVEVIRPMLMDTGGHALIIGTPRPSGVGFHWFRREYLRGMDPDYPTHASMKGPSEGNPYMRRELIAEERAACPSRAVERSEYDAEFVDAEGAVFERIEEAFCLKPQMEGVDIAWLPGYDPTGREVAIGYDPARHDDWGILSAWDVRSNHQVYVQRMRTMPFRAQLERVSLVKARFNQAVTYADNNGMGEALFEELAYRFGDGVVGRKWNHSRKEADVARGIGLFQTASWKFLDVPWQKESFYAYTRVRLPVMGYRYEASVGSKDDPVVAALLVAHRLVTDPDEIRPPEKPLVAVDESGALDPEWWFEKSRRAALDSSASRWI